MPVVSLSPMVRKILAPNPSPWTLEGTNTYLLGETECIVIDPGPMIAEHLEAVLNAAKKVSGILLTHHHPDHAEGADAFVEMTGAPVIEEDEIAVAGSTLRRIPTPGHSSDHVSFHLASEDVLFSGDHVLGRGTTVVAHPDGNMSAYMASLDRVMELAPRHIYPGHGPVIDEPAAVLAFYKRHRGEREAKILAAVAASPTPLDELLATVYSDVSQEVLPAAKLSLLAHLHKLASEGRVMPEGDAWRLR